MRLLLLTLLLFSLECFAQSKEAESIKIITEIVKDGKAKGYEEAEIRRAILSNVDYKIPYDDAVICMYLKTLDGCDD